MGIKKLLEVIWYFFFDDLVNIIGMIGFYIVDTFVINTLLIYQYVDRNTFGWWWWYQRRQKRSLKEWNEGGGEENMENRDEHRVLKFYAYADRSKLKK